MDTNEELAAIQAATEVAEAEELTPRVVATGLYGANLISVIECVIPRVDDDGKLAGATRAYLWHAVIGSFVLLPGYIIDGWPVPGRQVGAKLISTSTKSPEAALRNAQRRLAKG